MLYSNELNITGLLCVVGGIVEGWTKSNKESS